MVINDQYMASNVLVSFLYATPFPSRDTGVYVFHIFMLLISADSAADLCFAAQTDLILCSVRSTQPAPENQK